MHFVRLFGLVMMLVGSLIAQPALGNSAYADIYPFDLLQRSLKTQSPSERAILRGYLANEHADTAEGLFSAAWLAGHNGDIDTKIRLYQQAIEADPELTVAYINLALEHETAGRFDVARQLYDEALASAPLDGDVIRNSYFLRKNKDDNPEDAHRFLKQWEQEIGTQEYVFDFVRALDAEEDGRLQEAGELYRLTIEKDPPFEVYQRLIRLQLRLMAENELEPGIRYAVIDDILSPLQEAGDPAAFQFSGEILRDEFHSPKLALKQFQKAFEKYPTAELAETIFEQLAMRSPEESQAFLTEAAAELPGNYANELTLAWLNYHFLANPDVSRKHSLKALELAPHDSGRVSAITGYGLSLEKYGRFDEALAFYIEQQQRPYAERFQRQLGRSAVENRIEAQKFAEAAELLNRLSETGESGSDWFKYTHGLVEQARQLEMQPQPGSSDALQLPDTDEAIVRFAFGSAQVPARSRALLSNVAKVLEANEDAVLSIEGHTDMSGNGRFNFELSLDRAKAVQTYLNTHHQLPLDRLQISGHGPAFPEASNRNRGGRAENRRVELRVMPASSQAEQLADMDDGAFASDGRRAVLGQSPPQLWDLRANTKLHDFYRGRTHRFSPDNALVSSISEYVEEGGQTTNALYIYDTESGVSVGQIHEPVVIDAIAWRPDSQAIAYVTEDGFLKLYDVQQKQFLAVTRMGAVRIGGPLNWLPDGSAIIGGQHRMTSLKVFDGVTLAELRELEGVNWPHAIGISPDGRYVLAFDNKMQMSVWDVRNWQGPRQVETPMIPQQLAFHPTRPWVVLNARFEASDTTLAVMDYAAMVPISQWQDEGTFQIGLMPGNETLLAGKGDRLLAFRAPSLRLSGEVLPTTRP
ncbi:OmpA family protein [Aureimonas fodinaquatilis]|nr:OmpA family protein [Aureimonas fodinaquatilis]